MIRQLNKTLPLLFRAIQIVWRNRGLWVLGLLVAVATVPTLATFMLGAYSTHSTSGASSATFRFGPSSDGRFVDKTVTFDEGTSSSTTGGWWLLPIKENPTSVITLLDRPEGLSREYSYFSLPAAENGFEQEIDYVTISSPYASFLNAIIPFDRLFAQIVYSAPIEEAFVGLIQTAAAGGQPPISHPVTIGLMSLFFTTTIAIFFFLASAIYSAAFTVTYVEFVERKIKSVETTPKSRTAGLHQDAIQTSKDFDEPLPDDFWQGAQ